MLLIPSLAFVVLTRSVVDKFTNLKESYCIVAASAYLLATCLVLMGASIVANDPLKLLYVWHERAVVAYNLALAAYFVWFLSVLATEAVFTCHPRNVAQLAAAASIAVHYFVFAWRRIFTDKSPQLLASNYLIYATLFAFVIYERCLRINPR